MNSQRPQNPDPDFPEAFDNDELEIDVTYEEISPEEQLEIKQRASEAAPSLDRDINYGSEPIVDIWLDDELPNDLETESLSDNSVTSSSNLEDDELPNNSKTELLSDNRINPSDVEDDELPNNSKTELLSDNSVNLSSNLEDNELSNNSKTESLSDNSVDSSNDVEDDALLDNLKTESLSDNSVTSSNDVEDNALLDNLKTESLLDNSSTPSNEVEDDILTNSLESELKDSETASLSDSIGISSNDVEDDILPDTSKSEARETKEINQINFVESEPEQSITEVSTPKTELIADSWLDESENIASSLKEKNQQRQELSSEITELKQQKASLLIEIKNLQAQKKAEIAEQTQELANNLVSMIEEGTRELKDRKNNILIDLEKLERRRERIRQEMNSTFAGASQDLAVRIQGFKEYLVGSLQDLATAAERLDLPKPEDRRRVSQDSTRTLREDRQPRNISPQPSSQPQFREQAFAEQTRRIRQLLEQYRTNPDYYGSPWQLRRTFEPIHAEKVQDWFLEQGGRGAIKGMGSRLQNVLIASAIISILYRLYRDRCRILVLVDTPEKLGEWRKGLQDCLGISRNDFGSNRGVVLFESADVLVQRAERLLEDKLLPLIIIDETEELINLNLLKFPLWLAFAEKPQPKSSGYLY